MNKSFVKPVKQRATPPSAGSGQASRKGRNQPAGKGLFLGQKVLGELRILMRLSANSQTNGCQLSGVAHDQSF